MLMALTFSTLSSFWESWLFSTSKYIARLCLLGVCKVFLRRSFQSSVYGRSFGGFFSLSLFTKIDGDAIVVMCENGENGKDLFITIIFFLRFYFIYLYSEASHQNWPSHSRLISYGFLIAFCYPNSDFFPLIFPYLLNSRVTFVYHTVGHYFAGSLFATLILIPNMGIADIVWLNGELKHCFYGHSMLMCWQQINKFLRSWTIILKIINHELFAFVFIHFASIVYHFLTTYKYQR